MGFYLKYLLQLILSPVHGWEDIGAAPQSQGEVASRGFYPLSAITALSVFAGKIFHPLRTLQELLIEAIITFVMFFLGYFFATFVLSTCIGPVVPGHTDERRCQLFSLYVMGMLELIAIIGNIVPITLAITWFLPVYVAVVMWKGAEFAGVKRENSGRFMLLAVPGVLLPPYILKLVFSIILKSGS